jgi:hypothetical protein
MISKRDAYPLCRLEEPGIVYKTMWRKTLAGKEACCESKTCHFWLNQREHMRDEGEMGFSFSGRGWERIVQKEKRSSCASASVAHKTLQCKHE